MSLREGISKEMKEQPEQVLMAGGKAASTKIPSIHLIPTETFLGLAERMDLGVLRKGDKSWNALSNNQEVLENKEFLIERIGHIIYHALKLRDKLHEHDIKGLKEDDDASAILWGGSFLRSAVQALLKKEENIGKAASEVAFGSDNDKDDSKIQKQQSEAWQTVFLHCLNLGMDTKNSGTGEQNVLNFISSLKKREVPDPNFSEYEKLIIADGTGQLDALERNRLKWLQMSKIYPFAPKGGHFLYRNDVKLDRNIAPRNIKDGNGEIVLDMCKICRKAEVELGSPCPYQFSNYKEIIKKQEQEAADDEYLRNY